MTREEALDRYTHKAENFDLEKRVVYTMLDDGSTEPKKMTIESSRDARISKCLGLLMKTLRDDGVLSDEQVDDILLGSVT